MVSINLGNLNTSLVNSLANMFSDCNSLESIDISKLDTSHVISMEYLFSNCYSLKSLDLSTFNTAIVENMAHMFHGCKNLIYLKLQNFNTSNVKYMDYMFSGCSSLKSFETTFFDTSSVEDMSHMFEDCLSLITINLSNFDTHLTRNMDNMFSNDINLTYVNLANMQDTQMDSMLNIFSGTLENMVFCINKEKAPNFNLQIENKGCSIIDCDQDWKKNRRTIFAHSNKCIAKCDGEYQFWFDYKCYYRCPDNTFPENLVCKKADNDTSDNVTCNIRNFFIVGCNYDLKNDAAKQKFIAKTLVSFNNMELYDLAVMVLDHHKNYVRKVDGVTFQVYALDDKKRDENLAYVDLDQCGELLKQKHKLHNDKLLVFKIEYNSLDFKIPIIEYTIFGRGGKAKLNLNHCKSLKINYFIPRNISDYQEYLYDPENRFYTDRCYSFISEDNTDLTLYERQHFFNVNNMSLCESMCKFKGYLNNKIICECNIKMKFNSFLNANVDKYNLIYKFESDKLVKKFNIWVMKCFFYAFTIQVLTTNVICFVIFGILLAVIITTIVFAKKEKHSFYGQIEQIIAGTSIKTNFEGKNIKSIPFKHNTKATKAKQDNNPKAKGKISNKKRIGLKNNKINEPFDVNNDLKNEQSSRREIKEKDASHGILLLDEINNHNKNQNKHNNSNNNNINNGKDIIKAKIAILEKTDNELNFEEYKKAKSDDKRSCIKYYTSLIRTKNILIFPFSKKNDFNPRSMKICFLFLILGLILTISVLFIDDTDIHELYVSKGSFNIFFHLHKILYASIISLILKDILLWTIFPERNFIEIKNKIVLGKYIGQNKEMAILSFKCACFFPLSIILLTLFWIYIMCFGTVFRNMYFHILKVVIINLGLQIIFPFVYNVFPCIFRFISLSGVKNKVYLYRFSQFLQLL